MFQPETEDMLPRLAPKPSPDVLIGVCDGIIRPQVPEVSILFGQQDANLQQHTLNITSHQQQSENKSFPAQSYAAWKKQMLPKVNYLAPANMADIQIQENNIMLHDYNNPRTNLYPMRPISAQPVSMAVNVNGYAGTSAEVNQMTYRRSMENGTSNIYQQTMQPPLSTFNQLPNTRDILTLCAGTQTDTVLDSDPMSNFASKKDIENIRNILDEVRVEQQRLVKLLETFLYSHHSQIIVKSKCRDVGVQVDCTENEEQCSDIESIQVKQPQATKNKFLQHKKSANTLQTHSCKPIAQSTAYRPNSPQLQLLERELAANQQISSKTSTNMPKSSSDTSLAMNELALKYLPNEKLTELLKELNMDCPLVVADKIKPPAPVRTNINKFEKSSSDISNASYKYLKKYRLLPEDQEEKINIVGTLGKGQHVDQDQILHYNSPQYNNNLKMNQRQTPCSPYTGRLPLSPLVKASQSPLQSNEVEHIVDLENIKQQPKLL